ncbi:ATP-binding protein [Calderihabitans maritimus]|uniref:Circadian input-output histidine kinase CikA n=1 Tax=Calderihabitans maritimus TaxID=1246530 RepID=A0A1Z5HT51_9FIRM|nr:ATP-binding protein [Calderihabitans maritimus]GAW92713.1 histidine kinase [Calderihabitans maritimus]
MFSRLTLTQRFMLVITIAVLIVATAAFWWDMKLQQEYALKELKEKARVIALQLVATRQFIAANQDRINSDSQGHFEFKGLNPAAVGKGVGDIFSRLTRYRFKQTRLEVRNPDNAPDDYEKKALLRFKAEPDLEEIWGIDIVGGEKVFRYLIPLYYEEPCMACHGKPAGEKDISGNLKEGHEAGELAGAISITTPMSYVEEGLRRTFYSHLFFFAALVVWLLFLLNWFMNRLVSSPLRRLMVMASRVGKGEWGALVDETKMAGEIRELARQLNSMAAQLKELYAKLEVKVEERTRQLKEANRQLRAQQQQLKELNRELREANRVKSEFMANISHELRTPLTAILAFTEMLLDGAAGRITEEQKEYLQDIAESGQQLLKMIDDLLRLSKIEAGKMELNRSLIEVYHLVEGAVRTVKPLAERKGLVIHTKVEEGLPSLFADREKLGQVLLNLLSNAVKFTPAGGYIEVRAGLTKDGRAFSFAVKDTGIGIAPEDQKIIFEKFRQVDGSPSRSYGGSGLGLALAKHLVELHGGELTVESEPGKGSTFTFVIPAQLSEGEVS